MLLKLEAAIISTPNASPSACPMHHCFTKFQFVDILFHRRQVMQWSVELQTKSTTQGSPDRHLFAYSTPILFCILQNNRKKVKQSLENDRKKKKRKIGRKRKKAEEPEIFKFNIMT